MFEKIISRLPESLQVFAERFSRGPLSTPEELAAFIHTRSAYVAQTSLYGYLKTRMGTRFRDMFEDDVFSKSIHDSAIRLFTSCAADFCVFSVSLIAEKGDRNNEFLTDLAKDLYARALSAGWEDIDGAEVPDEALAAFHARISALDWQDAETGARAFESSIGDLIRFAPVIDEFKDLDREIVMNSIRLRWRDAKEQLVRRLDCDAFQKDARDLSS